jgi:hypothetical protein
MSPGALDLGIIITTLQGILEGFRQSAPNSSSPQTGNKFGGFGLLYLWTREFFLFMDDV